MRHKPLVLTVKMAKIGAHLVGNVCILCLLQSAHNEIESGNNAGECLGIFL